ncbi:MAG: tetratricopeptide repeat protein [Chloroflexi bacterium]|nr:tetratricopeptide repeat protein [Chloroflexota bacterium]
MGNHEYWNELGNLYFMNGAYETAAHAYLRSIQMDKKFGRPYSNLALTFVHSGKYREAIRLYLRSIDLLPDAKEKAITWNRLGALYRQVGDYKKALAAYQQADSIDPRPGEGISNKVDIPLAVSMPSIDLNAVLDEGSAIKEAEKQAPAKEAESNLNPARAQMNPQWLDSGFVPLDPEKIQQVIDGEAQPIPLNVEVKSESAGSDVPVEASRSSEIENINETAHQLPELPLGEMLEIEQKIAKHKAETDANPRNITAWEDLSDAYKAAGRYEEAIHAMKTAIANNPKKPSYYYRLGLIYAAVRRDAEAALAFERVLEFNPNHALAHASLGRYYRKTGNEELAQKHIKQALSTNFDRENPYNQACLQAICGNTERAFELLQIALQTKQTCITWAKDDPDLDSLHGDHRFTAILSSYATAA